MTAAVRTCVLLGALGVALLVHAAPAAAHTRLVGTEPEADATVSDELARVVLEFSEPVNQSIGEVAVRAPDGSAVADDGVNIDGARVEQRLGALTDKGAYTVSYRVVASDGHPLTGTFRFNYDGPLSAREPEPPPPTATPDPSETRDVNSHERPEADHDETDVAGGREVERDDGPGQAAATAVAAEPLPWLLLGITACVLLGFLLAAARTVWILVRWQPEK